MPMRLILNAALQGSYVGSLFLHITHHSMNEVIFKVWCLLEIAAYVHGVCVCVYWDCVFVLETTELSMDSKRSMYQNTFP
jgi:hypothetical protein